MNQLLLEILIRQVKDGRVNVEDIKDNDYKQAVITELGGD